MKKNVPMGEAVSEGLETFKRNTVFLLGVFIALTVINGIMSWATERGPLEDSFAGFLLSIAQYLAAAVLEMGLIAIMLQFADHRMPEFGDLFNRVSLLPKFIVAQIVYSLMVMAGLILLIVPGIYLGIRFGFFCYFIVDEDCGPFESFEKSSDLTSGVKKDLFLFYLMLAGINILGLLCFVVGVFVTLPITSYALAYVFRYLQTHQASVEGDIASSPT